MLKRNPKIKIFFTFFAVFASFLMVSAAVGTPVTSKLEPNEDLMEEINQFNSLKEKLEKDDNLMDMAEKLSEKKVIDDLYEKLKSAKTEEDLNNLIKSYENSLLKETEFNEMTSLLEKQYLSDIQSLESLTSNFEVKKESRLFEPFTSPDKYKTKDESNLDFYPLKAITFVPDGESGNDLCGYSLIKDFNFIVRDGNDLSTDQGSNNDISKHKEGDNSGNDLNSDPDWVPWFPGKIILTVILGLLFLITRNGFILSLLLFLWMLGFILGIIT